MSSDNDNIDDAFWSIVSGLDTPTPAAAIARLLCADVADYAQAEVDGAFHMWGVALAW